MHHATAAFDIEHWDEKPYGDPTLAHAEVRGRYSGDLVGTGAWLMLLAYPSREAASSVCLERFSGRLGDREGTFLLRHTGWFGDGVPSASFEVVPGSGTGALVGLRGHGGYSGAEERTIPEVVLDYYFAD